MDALIGLLIIIGGLYLFVREFFVRDVDMLFGPDNSRGGYDGQGWNGHGRLREWRGPIYWSLWLIRQW